MSPAARPLRRRVGPTAWATLEDVLGDAAMTADGRVNAQTNVRRIAGHLGVGKDTAARAVNRLVGLGLLVRPVVGRADDGTFTPACYEICAEILEGLVIEAVRPAVATMRRPNSASNRRDDRRSQQQALFEPEPAARR